MDPLLTEREFWKQTIEEYGLEDKLEAVVRDPCISWAKIARIPSTDSDNTKSTVFLGGTILLEVSRAVLDCENFMSQVFRLQAIVADGITHHCFVKVLPQKPALREMARKFELYQREIIMYSHVFPYLRNLLTQIELNPADYLIVPHLYHANLGLNDNGLPTSKTILATEDLRIRGFRMVNKKQGCDLNHAKCALRSLAYFHALSNTMLRKTKNQRENLKYLDFFTKTDAPENSPTVVALFKSCIQSVGEAIEQLGCPVIVEKLAICGNNAEQNNAREVEEEAGLLACLIHGDYWSNNMLFQYDEQTGLPTATAMVDWQLAAVGHPARDIGYFFLTSTRNSVWRNHWSELLLVYFEHLRSLLCQLGLDLEASGYTESRFMNEIRSSNSESLANGDSCSPTSP